MFRAARAYPIELIRFTDIIKSYICKHIKSLTKESELCTWISRRIYSVYQNKFPIKFPQIP